MFNRGNFDQEPMLHRRLPAYPQGYIDQVFTLWYSLGKPTTSLFYPKVPVCEIINDIPPKGMVKGWIDREFKERAIVLDEQVMSQINQRMVAEKVEMLNRHADLGKSVQDMAIKYLDEHKDELNVSNSVRLLVEGVRIERESRGISTTIEKITNLSDDELQKQVEQLISRSPVEFMPLEELNADNEPEQEIES